MLRTKMHVCFILSVALSATLTPSCFARDISLFIVTGQSNARAQYATGIESGLRASGIWDDVVVYHSRFSGNWLGSWVQGANGDFSHGINFTEDLWNSEGTAALQQLIQSFEDQGDIVTIKGFFWFQGEGDTGSMQARADYTDKLVWMFEQLRDKYGTFDILLTIIDWNHDLLDDLKAIGRTPENVEEIRASLVTAANILGAATHDSRDYPRLDVWHVGNAEDPRGQYAKATDLGADEVRAFIDHTQCMADLNHDGEINFFDISKYLQLYQAGCH